MFSWLGDFNDESSTVKLLLIQSSDSLFSSLEGGKGYKTIASRTSTTLYHLGRDSARKYEPDYGTKPRKIDVHISSGSIKKGFEALVSGRICKVASKDLKERLEGEKSGIRTEMTLWPGVSSVMGWVGTPFSVEGAGGASDMVRGTILDAQDERRFEPVFVEQLDGLRREGRPGDADAKYCDPQALAAVK